MPSPALERGANAAEGADTGHAEARHLFRTVIEEVVDPSEQLPIHAQRIGTEEIDARVARKRREVGVVVEALAFIGEAAAQRRAGKRLPGQNGARQIVRPAREILSRKLI